MANSRPVSFVEYTCGHSSPVRGTGARVDRPCEVCAVTRTGAPLVRDSFPSLRRILGGPAPYRTNHLPAHPGPDCDCDMCQSRIP